MNRKEAISQGLKTYTGKVCKCGCTEKYVSNYGCVKCTLNRNDPEYIKQYSKSDKAKARSADYIEKIKSEGKLSDYNKKWRETTGKDNIKLYYKNNKDAWRHSHLKRTYNITLEDYTTMLVNQNYCCDICGRHIDEVGSKGLAVDHCHQTNKIRGLLCKSCNVGLGNFRDSVDLMNKAIKYIEGHAC